MQCNSSLSPPLPAAQLRSSTTTETLHSNPQRLGSDSEMFHTIGDQSADHQTVYFRSVVLLTFDELVHQTHKSKMAFPAYRTTSSVWSGRSLIILLPQNTNAVHLHRSGHCNRIFSIFTAVIKHSLPGRDTTRGLCLPAAENSLQHCLTYSILQL